MVLGAKNFGGHGLRPENWHFSFLAAPASEAWVAMGSPNLQPWAATATGRSCNTLWCRWAEALWQHALFDQTAG